MKDTALVKTGIAGSLIAAICCFTPVLALALGAAGLTAWLARLDYVLLPALAVFVALTGFGLWRRRRAAACCAADSAIKREGA
jgi:mercuric ion transport protein